MYNKGRRLTRRRSSRRHLKRRRSSRRRSTKIRTTRRRSSKNYKYKKKNKNYNKMRGGFDSVYESVKSKNDSLDAMHEENIRNLFRENEVDDYIKSDVLFRLLTKTEGIEKLDDDEAQDFIKQYEVEGKGVPYDIADSLIMMIVPN